MARPLYDVEAARRLLHPAQSESSPRPPVPRPGPTLLRTVFVRPRYWGALKDAERVCTHCTQKKRCDRWHDWGVRNNAPFIFCPNARLFDEIATTPGE